MPEPQGNSAIDPGLRVAPSAQPDLITPIAVAAPKRVVVGISGASGAIYGVRLLQALQAMAGVETHLVVSDTGWLNLQLETPWTRPTVEALANHVHPLRQLGACIASGSFQTHAMVVAPCSMRTLAAIAHGLSDNLLTRTADVLLKERRRLVLMVRESPLHLVHLRNMLTATELGAVVCPPMPAFYTRPQTLDDLVNHSVARVLDLLDLPHHLSTRWMGLSAPPPG